LLARQVDEAVEVAFGKSKFLNTSKTELAQCFENAIQRS